MADVELAPHHDDEGGFALSLPADWTASEDQTAGVPFVAAESRQLGALRANLVVTVDEVSGLSFKDWQLGNDQLLAGALKEYQLLDLELMPVAGHDGVRRLATHTVGDSSATMEQWATSVDGRGYTLTFTVPTLRYATMAPGLSVIADTFTVSDTTGDEA